MGLRLLLALAFGGAVCSFLQADDASNRPTDQFARVNGVRLHYVTTGKGPLILFLHGFPEFWYAWKNQLAEFGRDYLAVAPDMRGYNLSEKPPGIEPYEMQHLIEDVRALARHLGYRKFFLVGHDWGGAVAWAYAIAHPESLDKLVIVNAPHPGVFGRLLREDAAQQKASAYMLLFRGEKAEETLTGNNYAVLTSVVLAAGLKTGAFSEEDRQAYLKAWSQPGAVTGGLNYYRAAKLGPPPPGADPAPAFDGGPPSGNLMVKTPTLVIWGEKDTALLPANLDGLEQFVPQLTVKRIPDASHWVVHEKPAEVNAYIRDFLRSGRKE